MRSPDSRRAASERALRVLSLVALVALALRLWSGSTAATSVNVITTASLDSALTAWSVVGPARAVVEAATVPEPRQRDWLVALRRTGTAINWTSADSQGGALVAEQGALPGGMARVTALGAPGGVASLTDDLGRIDSATIGAAGIATWRVSPIGAVRATLNSASAAARARDSLATRPVLVVGEAGWESKFVTAALEEDGWPVAARVTVAPAALVRQGPTTAIDTATLSAVVVLDSTSTLDGGALARFVSEGGGVVAAGAGSRHPALRPLLPRTAGVVDGAVGALLGPSPRDGLAARTFVVSTGTVALDRRGDAPVILGRRLGSGRLVVVGYDDTWRLRMTPPDERAPGAHREWWSSLVAGVVHARLVPRAAGPVDEAPLAAAVDALGPPMERGLSSPVEKPWPWNALLAGLAAAALVAEWLSRRLRGVA